MISPEIRHFSDYDYLHNLLLDSTTNPTLLYELNLSNKEHTDTPPPHLLICFKNLRSLNLSYNKIVHFPAIKLLQGIPLLEKLDLSHNSISTLEDLTELGISRSLRSLNIIGNPIAKQYPRIRLVEFLLFPNKSRTYNPVEVLTATYNMASSNTDAVRKHEIIVNRVPGTSKSKKGAYVTEDNSCITAKLTQEICPVPRSTNFPVLGIFNEEIISIRDIQTILVKKDISSALFEKRDNGGPKRTGSEKLHLKYIEAYTRRKNRIQERIDLIPSLERLSHMIRSDDSLKLLYSQDRIRYDKLKIKKPDYEEILWNGPLDLLMEDTDFTIGIAQLKQADSVLNEKKERKKKFEREFPKAVKSYDDPNREKRMQKMEKLRKKENEGKQVVQNTVSTCSVESSIPEQNGDIRDSINFSGEEMEVEEVKEMEEADVLKGQEIKEEEPHSAGPVSPEKLGIRRALSLPKYVREVMKSNKHVTLGKDEEEGVETGNTRSLIRVRRTNSECGGLEMKTRAPGLFLEGLQRRSSTEKIEEQGLSVRPVSQTNKRFGVVQESVPNVGLPLFGNSEKARKHVRSVSVQPAVRKLSKESLQLFDGIKIHTGREMNSSRLPFFSGQEKSDGVAVDSLNNADKSKKTESRRNSHNSGSTLGLPYVEFSRIKGENESDQPFFSSNQVFNSMRSDILLEWESKEKVTVVDDEYGIKNRQADEGVNSGRVSLANTVNSLYRINLQSGLENAPSGSGALNSFRKKNEEKSSSQANHEGSLKLPKDVLEASTDKNGFKNEKEGLSRPNTARSAFDLYNEIQASLAANKLQVQMKPLNEKNFESKPGILKVSSVIGVNPENNQKRHTRSRSSITISVAPQKDKQKGSQDKKGSQKILVQELTPTLSPNPSFLSSRLSKNNNHSLAHLRKLRAFGINLNNRLNLEIQGEQIEELNFTSKVKFAQKEEMGLDSTTAFSSKRLKSRSGSAENFRSSPGVPTSQTERTKIRSIRLKQAL